MILLRAAELKDISQLEQMSTMATEKHPGFLNLAKDGDQWKEKIEHSLQSFSGTLKHRWDAKYLFVAEEVETGKIFGMSMMAAQHGTEEHPHFYFQVDTEKKYSETLGTGFIHSTLTLKYETDGPTEIGGLIVDPESRNSPERIGRQLSFVRFLFMGIHPENFKRRVLAELLPPLGKKGKSPLWEAIGRRFTNMDYAEADALSAKNKEFILSLFPTGKIYATFLTAEARNAIGKVGKDTEPVLHMLKKIGFEYKQSIDPFDGGPHLVAELKSILPIQKIKNLRFGGDLKDIPPKTEQGLFCKSCALPFQGMKAEAMVEGDEIFFDAKRADLLNIRKGEALTWMPFY